MGSTVRLTRECVERAIRGIRPNRCANRLFKPAAVLLPLFRQGESIHIWLMRRPDDGTPHGGQVSLPGGKPSPNDADLSATALREAEEEIGLPQGNVQLLGSLDCYVTITGFCIRPYVGWIPSNFSPTPNPQEVARVFSSPLAVFLGARTDNRVQWGPIQRAVPSFRVDGEVVWGATGAILHEFGMMLRAAMSSEPECA